MNFTRKFGRRAAIVLSENEHLVPGVSFMGFIRRYSPLIFPIAFAALWVYQGCTDNPLGVIDPQGVAPQILGASVTPDSVYLDAMIPSQGSYSVPVVLNATVRDTTGTISAVSAIFTRPGESDPYLQIRLQDDGVAPDLVAGDGIFTSRTTISLTRAQSGTHLVQVWATDSKGYRSRSLNLPLRFGIRNSPPMFGVPSTRSSSSGPDSLHISFFVPASDSNGLGSISSVTVRFRNAYDTASHQLFDDGLAIHSDYFPGDGIFSGTFWVVPTGLPDSLSFTFTAVDNQGGASTFSMAYPVNHPPVFVSLNVPSIIVRPSSGILPVYFYAKVKDPDGLSDIDSVYFRNYSSSTPKNILMYDDGNLSLHGDAVAKDSTYSLIVQITSANTPGQNIFHFTVVDKEGASATIIDTITVE